MAELKHSKRTPGLDLAVDRLMATALEDPERYSGRTAFIAADHPDFQAMLALALAERRPLAIVYPDGREMVAVPASNGIRSPVAAALRVLARLRRPHARANGAARSNDPASLALPGDYAVEFREASVP